MSKQGPAKPLCAWANSGLSSGCSLHGLNTSVALAALIRGTSLDLPLSNLRGRSVLVAVEQQLAAALAVIELDGVAQRLVLCPPGISDQHRAQVIASANIDAVVCDEDSGALAGVSLRGRGGATIRPGDTRVDRDIETEWVMLTSGTSGAPKLVQHSLASLIGAIGEDVRPAASVTWGTFYDIRRFGGLQILLRAILGGRALVLSDARESIGRYLARAGARGVTHLSGTPSHWRNALAYGSVQAIAPRYIRLSGEIADRALLDALKARFPQAEIVHAYASTEAGVGFEVDDGCEGFPASLLGGGGAAEMKLVDGSLRVRSARAASRYVGGDAQPLKDADGFIDTGDFVEVRGGRCYFVGRRGGIINVGGLKVSPEEVEAVINRHPDVQASFVHARKNLITGAMVIADVVLRGECSADDPDEREGAVRRDILLACRQDLASYKVPASIRFVEALQLARTGKSPRQPASAPRELTRRESTAGEPTGDGVCDAGHG